MKMGYPRNGCMFCGFGVQLEPDGHNRYQKLKKLIQLNITIFSIILVTL